MRALASLTLTLFVLFAAPVFAEDEQASGRPSVVVTTEVLGAITQALATDLADVTVLMSGGADPHSWQPSARDSEALFEADLIVANGLDLEEGLLGVLEQAEAEGVPIFRATDHLAVLTTAREGDDDEDEIVQGTPTVQEGRVDHEHAAGDPHFWLDPLAMRDVVLALGPVMADAGIGVADRAGVLAADLEALDVEIAELLSVVSAERRQLVTGHGALGYFADRYGFHIVGTVIPGLSSSDEPSAMDVAELIEAIREAGTSVVFVDVGTPESIAEAVAAETGAQLVELHVEQLPGSGEYADLLREIATSIAEALAA